MTRRFCGEGVYRVLGALLLFAAACHAGDQKGEDDALLFGKVSFRATGSVSLEALPEADATLVGQSDDGRAVYRRTEGGEAWQLLTRDGAGWKVWQPAALSAAVSDLAQRLDVAEEDVDVREVARVTWPDACLGAPRPGEACAQVLTEGFRIVLSLQGLAHEYHADLAGNIRALR